MSSPISLGKIDIKLLIPITSGVLRIITNYIFINLEAEFFNHPVIYNILPSLSRCLGLFFYLREPNIDELCDSDSIKEFKKIKYQKYVFIFLASIFDFLESALSYFEDINVDITSGLDIIFVSLFSFLILKTKFYKHQFYVIILSIILIIILSLLESTNMKISTEEIIKTALKIFSLIFNNLVIVIDKYIIEKKSATVFEIFFYNGLITLILNLIYLIVWNNNEIPDDDQFFYGKELVKYRRKRYFDNFFAYINEIKIKKRFEIVNIISEIFLEFFIRLLFLYTIKFFSPSYLLLILLIQKIPSLFYNKYIDWNSYKAYLTIIIFCFLIFLSLVLIEIIELNFCGLAENTKKNIQLRAQLDALEAENIFNVDGKEEIRNTLIDENLETTN